MAWSINIWDSESTGVGPPPLLGPQSGTEDGPIYYYEGHGVQALNRWRTLSVLDAESAEGWFWAPSPDAMPSWERAAPLRAILHWWLGRRGILYLHGGAVGTADGGVLVVGRGGSGKSTTTLACVAAGLRYAGDDYVAVAPGPQPWVHSLYSSGKLEDHQLARFPALGGAVGNLERDAGEKAVVFVEEAAPGAPIAGFPLRAILVPEIVAQTPETRAVPRPAAAALAALAPSTIFQLHPPQPGMLAEMARAGRSRPVLHPPARLGSGADPGSDRRTPGGPAVSNPLVSVVIPVYNARVVPARRRSTASSPRTTSRSR